MILRCWFCDTVEPVLTSWSLATNMWSVKTGGLWWQVQLYWNVGSSAKNVWSFKTGGQDMAVVSQERFHCITHVKQKSTCCSSETFFSDSSITLTSLPVRNLNIRTWKWYQDNKEFNIKHACKHNKSIGINLVCHFPRWPTVLLKPKESRLLSFTWTSDQLFYKILPLLSA